MAAMSFHLEKSNYAQIIPMDMRHILPKFYESRFNPRKVMRILRIGKFWRKIIIIILTETIGLLRSLEALIIINIDRNNRASA